MLLAAPGLVARARNTRVATEIATTRLVARAVRVLIVGLPRELLSTRCAVCVGATVAPPTLLQILAILALVGLVVSGPLWHFRRRRKEDFGADFFGPEARWAFGRKH